MFAFKSLGGRSHHHCIVHYTMYSKFGQLHFWSRKHWIFAIIMYILKNWSIEKWWNFPSYFHWTIVIMSIYLSSAGMVRASVESVRASQQGHMKIDTRAFVYPNIAGNHLNCYHILLVECSWCVKTLELRDRVKGVFMISRSPTEQMEFHLGCYHYRTFPNA